MYININYIKNIQWQIHQEYSDNNVSQFFTQMTSFYWISQCLRMLCGFITVLYFFLLQDV